MTLFVRSVRRLVLVGVVSLGAACSDPPTAPDTAQLTIVAAPDTTQQTTTPSGAPTSHRLTDAERDRLNRDLVAAAWANDVLRATELIDAGADVNFEDDTQQSAFLIAASEGHYELLELTLDRGADLGALDSYNGTALIRAAERGHGDVCERLIRAGITLDHINYSGYTALLEAVVYGDGSARYQQVVAALLAAGADPAIPDAAGITAYEHAVSRGQTEIAALLAPG